MSVLKMFGTFVAGSAVFGISALYILQNKLVYPSWAMDGRGHVDTPASFGLQYEEHFLQADGATLHMYAIPASKQSMEIPNGPSSKTVLVLCPNAGNIGHSLPLCQLFHQFGYNVVIYSYRGYGRSSGSADEAGLKNDADTFMKWFQNDEYYSKTDLILYGRSLGGANAIWIAHKYPVVAVILENTFLSLTKVIPYLYPLIPAQLCHEKWPSEDIIGEIKAPILFLSGLKDEIVPPPHMKGLYDLCKSHKEWKEFSRGHHNDTVIQPAYWDTIWDFLIRNT